MIVPDGNFQDLSKFTQAVFYRALVILGRGPALALELFHIRLSRAVRSMDDLFPLYFRLTLGAIAIFLVTRIPTLVYVFFAFQAFPAAPKKTGEIY